VLCIPINEQGRLPDGFMDLSSVCVVHDQITTSELAPNEYELHRVAQHIMITVSAHLVPHLVPIHDETAKA
jgi:hypothetical protein